MANAQRAYRARRSCLAVPASSERFLEKARDLPADEVFLDLEDAVAPGAKDAARRNAVAALTSGTWRAGVRAVRINDATSPWAYRDAVAVAEGAAGAVDVIVLPKVTGPGHVVWLDVLLSQIEQAAGSGAAGSGRAGGPRGGAGAGGMGGGSGGAGDSSWTGEIDGAHVSDGIGEADDASGPDRAIGGHGHEGRDGGPVRAVRRIGIEAQIEDASGLAAVDAIAAASDRLEALVFGPADFMASLGMRSLDVGAQPEGYAGDAFHYALMRILVAARAHGLQAIDGPYLKIRDVDGFRRAAASAAALGFDGKWVLHPGQIEAANEVFTPSQADYDRAELILDAYAHSTTVDQRGAVMLGDEMIDEASRKMALGLAAKGRAAGLKRTRDPKPES
jgi:citrate lyase beta subunit